MELGSRPQVYHPMKERCHMQNDEMQHEAKCPAWVMESRLRRDWYPEDSCAALGLYVCRGSQEWGSLVQGGLRGSPNLIR